MAKQSKPIHLTQLSYGSECRAVCDRYFRVEPIEATIKDRPRSYMSKGTFNPTKVTCKRCLKHPKYKEAMDRVKYPLFHWRENAQ